MGHRGRIAPLDIIGGTLIAGLFGNEYPVGHALSGGKALTLPLIPERFCRTSPGGGIYGVSAARGRKLDAETRPIMQVPRRTESRPIARPTEPRHAVQRRGRQSS